MQTIASLAIFLACFSAATVAHASEPPDEFRLRVHRGWLFPVQHLPANAKGVLFQDDAPPAASGFTIRKGSARISVAVRLTRIRALDSLAPDRIEPVGKNRMMLFRVEPVGGFEPGQTYWFSSSLNGGAGFPVSIDTATVDLRQMRLMAVGAPNLESTRLGIQCPAPFLGQVVAQAIQYRAPAEWRKYGESIRTLTRNVSGAGWTDRNNVVHHVVSFDAFEFGSVWDERVLFSCATDLAAKPQFSQISGMIAFPEVDDKWIETAPLKIPLSSGSVTALDSLALLEDAGESGDVKRMLSALQRIPLREADYRRRYPSRDLVHQIYFFPQWWAKSQAKKRRESLLNQLGSLMMHKDSTVRAAASAALARVDRLAPDAEDR